MAGYACTGLTSVIMNVKYRIFRVEPSMFFELCKTVSHLPMSERRSLSVEYLASSKESLGFSILFSVFDFESFGRNVTSNQLLYRKLGLVDQWLLHNRKLPLSLFYLSSHLQVLEEKRVSIFWFQFTLVDDTGNTIRADYNVVQVFRQFSPANFCTRMIKLF